MRDDDKRVLAWIANWLPVVVLTLIGLYYSIFITKSWWIIGIVTVSFILSILAEIPLMVKHRHGWKK